MNVIERNKANAHLKQQELLKTMGGKLAAEYVKQQGDFERHQKNIFEKVEKGDTPIFSGAVLTEDQLQAQEVLKHY